MTMLHEKNMKSIVNRHLQRMAAEISDEWEKALPGSWRDHDPQHWYESCKIECQNDGFYAVTVYSYPCRILLMSSARVQDYLGDIYMDIRKLAQNDTDFRHYLCSS